MSDASDVTISVRVYRVYRVPRQILRGEPRRRVREMGQQPSSAEGGGFASRQTAECVRVRQETSKNLHRRLIFIVPTVSGQRDASS